MADAIVQTIKIEVEGADEASAEINKIGGSIEDVQKTAAQTGGGTQEFGKGLDEVSDKSRISGRELRSLSKIAKEFGADTAVVGLSLVRMATVLGPIGAALFAMAEAFSFVRSQMKAAEEETKAITTAFANIARVAAEVKLDDHAASWGKTSAALLAVQQASLAVEQGYISLARASEDAARQQISNALGIRSAQLGVRDAEIALAQAQGRTISDATIRRQKLAHLQLTLAAAREREAEAEAKAARDAEDASSRRQQMLLQQAQLEQALANAREAREKARQDQIKAAANDVVLVSEQLRNAAAGFKTALDQLTTKDTIEKAVVEVLERAGIKLDDLTGNTKEAAAAMRQAELEVAKIYDGLGLISRVKFKGVLKDLGFTDEQIKNIEKGSAALKLLQRPFFTPAQQQSIDNLATGWNKFADASKRAWAMVAGDAETGGSGLAQRIGAAFATGFADMMGIFGQLLHGQIPQAWSTMFQSIGQITSSKISEISALIASFVTTAPGNAWQWVSDTFSTAVGFVLTKGNETKAFIDSWVTTPAAGAWQWIKDTFWSVVNEIVGRVKGGGAAAAPAGTTGGGFAGGGLLGGRGTGTSDSNLAWVSRGEHIMPAAAVAQPGVLAFLEALRRSGGNLRGILDGMGRFALGGLVAPTLSIPAFAGGGMNHVTIQFPGLPEITGLRASSVVVDELRKAAALAQVRSGGRKPSRYS